jgi:hypothetical protein
MLAQDSSPSQEFARLRELAATARAAIIPTIDQRINVNRIRSTFQGSATVTTRISLLGLIIALFMAFPTAAPAGAPIQDLIDVPVPSKADGSKMSAAEVQAAIFAACASRSWTPMLEAPGKVKASILVRGKHYAEVAIDFTDTNYSIRYLTSRDLDFNEKKRTIHGNYNKWVSLLSSAITQNLVAKMSAPAAAGQ